ncbi:hypothetical protein [Salinarchaeum sp. IM2453]|uniref:DUF7563 family protein n=1 Tax=Salinarchaeum sp. IM2453 TaxID=2862870 RepID=UPI00217519AF|nr:hypothetical protein [Salinarchaeum sp. IM2453]
MTSQCQHCGAQVSEHYGRVFGDQNDTVHRCPACDCKNRLQKGSAAGKEINLPDPKDHPNRNRGYRVDDDHIDYGKGPVTDGGTHRVVATCPNCQAVAKRSDEKGHFTCPNDTCRCVTFEPEPIPEQEPRQTSCQPTESGISETIETLVQEQTKVILIDRPAGSFDHPVLLSTSDGASDSGQPVATDGGLRGGGDV